MDSTESSWNFASCKKSTLGYADFNFSIWNPVNSSQSLISRCFKFGSSVSKEESTLYETEWLFLDKSNRSNDVKEGRTVSKLSSDNSKLLDKLSCSIPIKLTALRPLIVNNPPDTL